MAGEIVFDILYYALIYFTVFMSVFWFVIFFENKNKVMRAPKPPRTLPSISLLIPAYNEETRIAKTIDSILEQNYPKEKLEIIVIDDASTDRTVEVARDYAKKYPNVRLIRHRKNRRKAYALNTGLKYVNTELIGFLDSDSILTKNSLRNMVGYLSNPKTGAVIANIQPKSSVTFSQKIQKIEYVISALLRKLLTFLNSLYMTPAFALYRTSVIKKLGGWDEENLAEDLEMGLRLKDNNYRIETCTTAMVKTSTPSSFRKLWSQRIRWYRGLLHNSRKYVHMFFNSKFEDLGMFVLPMHYIVLFLTIPVFLYGFYIIGIEFFREFFNLYLIGFDFQYALARMFRFSANPFNLSLMLVTLSGLIIFIKISLKHASERVKKLDYLIYIPLYPVINIAFWLSTFYYEIRRSEFKW